MPWSQLKLNTTGANAEELSDALMEAGAVSITFQDTHDTPVFEPLPGETRLWGDTDVIGLFDAETEMNDVIAQLAFHPLLGEGFAHKIEQLEDKDWERANAVGALSAMIVGGVLYAVLATFNIQYLGFHPIVPSLLLSLLAFVVGNRFGQPAPQAPTISVNQ